MSKAIPDVKRMMPADARKAITEFFLEKLVSADVNYYGEPIYKYVHALGNFKEPLWDSSVLHDCFTAAMATYNKEHPLCWDNDGQFSYRDGINDIQHQGRIHRDELRQNVRKAK